MPVSPAIELAEILAKHLSAAALGFEAKREYLPILKLEQLGREIQVFVIPKSEVEQPQARKATIVGRVVYVGVIKKLRTVPGGSFDREELDSLMGETMQAIKEMVKQSFDRRFGWIRTENDPLYDAEHLEKYRQFTSILTITYRAIELQK